MHPSTTSICVPISLGELIDKITILEIKNQQLQGAALTNVQNELDVLQATLSDLQLSLDLQLIERLRMVNAKLWQIEDDIREKERQQNFDDAFIELARAVYHTNDQRSQIKREINIAHGSALVEEKSYQAY